MDSSSRRKNFSSLEIEVLISCLDKRKSVIENKVTNGASNRAKHEAWAQVQEEFNSIHGVTPRTVSQLINLYKNMKRKASKNRADERIEIYKTGGGAPKIHLSEIDQRILGMSAVVQPLHNPHDLDAAYHCFTQNIGGLTEVCRNTNISMEDKENQEIDWSEEVGVTNGADEEDNSYTLPPPVIESSERRKRLLSQLTPQVNSSKKKRRNPSSCKAAEELEETFNEKKIAQWKNHELNSKILETQLEIETEKLKNIKDEHEAKMAIYKEILCKIKEKTEINLKEFIDI